MNDVPPYITVEPYKDTIWATSSPEAFYPQKSVAAQADPTQPYGGGSPAMGGWFSAVCYTFGRRLYRHFDGTVPIGLVDASWGGKTIEAFAPPSAINADGSVRDASCGTGGTASTAGTRTPVTRTTELITRNQLGLERGQQRRGGADGRRQVGEVAGPLAPEGHPHGRRELRRGDDVVDDDDAGPIGVESSEEVEERSVRGGGGRRGAPITATGARARTLLKLLSSLWENADSETRERFMEKLTEGEIGVGERDCRRRRRARGDGR